MPEAGVSRAATTNSRRARFHPRQKSARSTNLKPERTQQRVPKIVASLGECCEQVVLPSSCTGAARRPSGFEEFRRRSHVERNNESDRHHWHILRELAKDRMLT